MNAPAIKITKPVREQVSHGTCSSRACGGALDCSNGLRSCASSIASISPTATDAGKA